MPIVHLKEILMFKGKPNTAMFTFAASVAFSLFSGCVSIGLANLDLRTPAQGHSYDRKVLIRANTKFVNVDDGEVVKFVVQEPDGADKSFTWHFDTARETVGDLSKLAPTGVLGRSVKVYVGLNPRYY
jgi:Heavy-metal resistance protein CzcE